MGGLRAMKARCVKSDTVTSVAFLFLFCTRTPHPIGLAFISSDLRTCTQRMFSGNISGLSAASLRKVPITHLVRVITSGSLRLSFRKTLVRSMSQMSWKGQVFPLDPTLPRTPRRRSVRGSADVSTWVVISSREDGYSWRASGASAKQDAAEVHLGVAYSTGCDMSATLLDESSMESIPPSYGWAPTWKCAAVYIASSSRHFWRWDNLAEQRVGIDPACRRQHRIQRVFPRICSADWPDHSRRFQRDRAHHQRKGKWPTTMHARKACFSCRQCRGIEEFLWLAAVLQELSPSGASQLPLLSLECCS